MSPSSQLRMTLYRGFSHPGYVWSPFVTKLETRLRLSNVSHRTESGSLSKAPRGKIPYISMSSSDSTGDVTMGDSTLIIEKLTDEGIVVDLNGKLSAREKAMDLALRALLEEKMYFYQGYEKWHDNFYTLRSHIMGQIPWPLQPLIGLLAYRTWMATFHGLGTSRYSPEERTAFKKNIWGQVDALLTESKQRKEHANRKEPFWLLGNEEPTEVDSVLFGFIASTLVCTATPESAEILRGCPALMDYAGRIHEKYFPDYDRWE